MCTNKLMLLAGMLIVPSLVLNAMPSWSRPVSRVSSAVVQEIRSALASNRPELVLQLLRDNGLSVNSQLTDKHETVLHLVGSLKDDSSSANILNHLLSENKDTRLNEPDHNGMRPLHNAARLGKQQTVKRLLGDRKLQGALVNVRDSKSNSPLDYAQENGHTHLAELLQTYAQAELAVLQKEKTTESQDLFAAATNNDRAGVELLLAEGADVRERHHHERTTYNRLGFKTPFHIALEAEHYGLAAFLLKAAQGLNGLDEKGWTPLMLAIVADDWNMVRELIVDGADIFAGHRRNALDIAKMMKSEAKLVNIFIEEKGANGVVHTYGETLPFIELAWVKGYTKVVKLLHQHGDTINPEIINSLSLSNFWLPLMRATGGNDWKRARKLIKDGADIFAGHHRNALDVAAKMENKTKLIDIIVEKVGVNTPIDKHGNTLLILAADDVEVIELLLKHGADINYKNNKGLSVFTLAIYNHSMDIVSLLLKHTAYTDLNPLDYGSTGHWMLSAAYDGHTEVVKLLLKLGVDLTVHNWRAETALTVAAEEGQTEIVELLLEHGANPLLRVWIDSTALTYAKNLGYYNIAKILSAARQQLAVSVPLAQH